MLRTLVAAFLGIFAGILATCGSTEAKTADGSLHYVFCDLKRTVAGLQGKLGISDYEKLIDAFKYKLGCNGIRIHIDSRTPPDQMSATAADSNGDSYTTLYREVYAYSRKSGLLIYANLLPVPRTLEFGGNEKLWSDTVSAYVKYFCPDFVGPFNETGKFQNHAAVAKAVRAALPPSCRDPFGNIIKDIKIVGPDSTQVRAALRTLSEEPGLLENLDIVSAHNNNGGKNSYFRNRASDRSVNKEDWLALKIRAQKPVWASEAPVIWSSMPIDGQNRGQEVGLKAILDSKAVTGIVLYLAISGLNKTNFDLNGKGQTVVKELKAIGWKIPSIQ